MLEIMYKCPSFFKVLVNARKYFIFWNLVMWKCILGAKGVVCGPEGAWFADSCVLDKTQEMTFIRAKSHTCLSMSWPLGKVFNG
jgi:hypothetical protein